MNNPYVDYLESQFMNVNDAGGFTEEELTAPIMTREEFEHQQAVELYKEKAARAGALWDDALKGLSGVIHKWKWEYMDYLEDVKYRDIADVTLEIAKEEILSYGEFAELKETEGKVQEQASLLPVPTDDYTTEYATYCQRMGYTAERMKSIRYKMTVYDEFLEKYNYRKLHYGVRDESRMVAASEKNRGAR